MTNAADKCIMPDRAPAGQLFAPRAGVLDAPEEGIMQGISRMF